VSDDPPIGKAVLAALVAFIVYVCGWLLVSAYVALDPLSR
jgi:hypothetical protein